MGEPPSLPEGTAMTTRVKILRAVNSPLGFFVLALLIVESFLIGAGTLFGLPELWKVIALFAGVVLFLIVFITVAWLVRVCPRNVVFSEESHVAVARMYGDESKHLTGLEVQLLPAQETPNPPIGQLTASTPER
jgi:hypothetical protein